MRRLLSSLLILGMMALPAQAAEGRKYVALTFDDGPSGRYTQALLDGLAFRGARCTFLLCGYRIRQYPELTRRMMEEGHELGHHGYSHTTMKSMSRKSIGQELIDTQALLPEGCEPVFFRPPGGFVTDGVRQVAQARRLALLSWSVDPRDWATDSTGQIEKAVLKNVKDGDIVLLHDMTRSSVQAALDIVDVLQEQGYRFVTVSELARLRRVRLEPGKIYKSFPPQEAEPVK